MREIGKIKWLGGKRKEIAYGFVERKNGEDIFVHKKNIFSDSEYLFKGTNVSFEVSKNYKKGKEEAINLRLIKDDDDSEIIRLCAESTDIGLICDVLIKHLNKLTFENALKYVEDRIEDLSSYIDKNRIAQLLPIEFCQSLNIRKHLDTGNLIKGIVFLIETKNSSNKEDLINELIDTLKYRCDSKYWDFLNDKLLLDDRIWNYAPTIIKFKYYLKNLDLNDLSLTNTKVQEINNLIVNSTSNEKTTLLNLLPNKLKSLKIFIPYLSEIEQVTFAWEAIIKLDFQIWNLLILDAKIMTIYKAVLENENISSFGQYENNQIIKCLLEILGAKYSNTDKEKLFITFHNT